jgi:uncharacterized protein with PQ loop repeat
MKKRLRDSIVIAIILTIFVFFPFISRRIKYEESWEVADALAISIMFSFLAWLVYEIPRNED